MEGVELIECTDFFNILNQEMTYPMLSDPCYLLLFDEDGEFQIPMDAEVETKRKIVVYDQNTFDTLIPSSAAVTFAKHLWENGSKYPVKIINGGFQEFSARYPFLRTQEMLYTPQQMDNLFTYPVEVIPKFLYVGNHNQSQAGRVNKDLKVKSHVNVSTRHDGIFSDRLEIPGKDKKLVPALLEIAVEDKKGEDLFVHFVNACRFIDSHNINDGKSVLVFSDLGISRGIALAMAYLMHCNKWPLKVAWDHMKKCKSNMCPNRSFVEQLSAWEEQLFGKKIGDMNTIEPY